MKKNHVLLLLICLTTIGLLFNTSCSKEEVPPVDHLEVLTNKVENGIVFPFRNDRAEMSVETDEILTEMVTDPETGTNNWYLMGERYDADVNDDVYVYYIHFSIDQNDAQQLELKEFSYKFYDSQERYFSFEEIQASVEINEITATHISGIINVSKYDPRKKTASTVFNLPYVQRDKHEPRPYKLNDGHISIRLDSTIQRPCGLGQGFTIYKQSATMQVNYEAGKAVWKNYQSFYEDFGMKIEFETDSILQTGTYPLTNIEYTIDNFDRYPHLVNLENIPPENIQLQVILEEVFSKIYTATIVGTITDLQGKAHYFEVVHKRLDYEIN